MDGYQRDDRLRNRAELGIRTEHRADVQPGGEHTASDVAKGLHRTKKDGNFRLESDPNPFVVVS